MAFDQYRLLPSSVSAQDRHGQILEFLQEGEAWLSAQRPSTEWESVLDMLGPSVFQGPSGDGLSQTGFNNGKRIAKEIVASLTNFRHEGEIKATWDQDLYNQAIALTKRDKAWFRETHAHQRYRSVMQYAVAFGTGYGHQTWDSHFWGPSRGDVRLEPLAPDCVLCVQLPRDHDLQRAYIVFIREELPINLARRIYQRTNPAFAELLTPDRDSPGWLQKGLRKLQDLMGGSPIFRLGGTLDKKKGTSYPTVDLFHAYVMDDSVNESGSPVTMGTYRTNWSYTVPSLGSDMPTGMNDSEGRALTRKATEDDCALYPLRRLIIFSRSVPFPAYDGSSPWWHGKVPVSRFRFNDWAWEALGQSVIGDTRTMGIGIERIMQDVEDSSHARLDPPLLFDDQKVSKGFAETVNPRKAGVRAAVSLDAGEILKVLGQQWQYEVPTWIPEWIKEQIARQEKLTGSPDLVAIAKARQVPGEGTLEKLMEMAGPLVQDMIRSVEEPLADLGDQRKALYLQFDTKARMLQITGPLQEEEEFYYVPDLIVPLVQGESSEARRDRSKRYIHEFRYHVSESGINEIHRMTTKLAFLQLLKAGVPISWWTLAKIFAVPNFGPLPRNPETGQETHSEIETWIAQQHLMRELQQEMQQATGGPGGPRQQGPGRPPTNQRPPQLVQKDGGARSTVKTSQ